MLNFPTPHSKKKRNKKEPVLLVLSMAAHNAAAAQAELIEKEKHIMELQGKLHGLKQQLQNIANHQAALERERRRAQITNSELTTLTPEHKVYKGVGRMFVAVTVPTLTAETADRESKCTNEVQRIVEEKKKLVVVIQNEEQQAQLALGDFMNAVRIFQATQQVAAS